jgi:hypothetical protein
MYNLFKTTLTCLIITLLAAPLAVHAESNATKAKKSLDVIKSEVKKLKRLINRSGVRAQLSKSSAIKSFKDSDDDGLPDILEDVEGTDSCKDDSDDDGISDGDESDAGSRPDDDSSSEVELKNTITELTATTVTVGGYTFTVTEASRFKGGTSLASFQVGNFVEVSGVVVSQVLQLKKLSRENR